MKLRCGKIVCSSYNNIAKYLGLPDYFINIVYKHENLYSAPDYEEIAILFRDTDREFIFERDNSFCTRNLHHLVMKTKNISGDLQHLYIAIFYRLVYGTRLYNGYINHDNWTNQILKKTSEEKLEYFKKIRFGSISTMEFVEYLRDVY